MNRHKWPKYFRAALSVFILCNHYFSFNLQYATFISAKSNAEKFQYLVKPVTYET